MKKKIGELYGKPIVIGNSNEVTKNEIAFSELGGNNGASNNIKYYNLPNDAKIKQMIPAYSMLVKLDSGDMKVIYGTGQIIEMLRDEESSISEFYEYLTSCAVNFDAIFYTISDGQELKIKDLLIPEVIASVGLVEITKEEFFNLNI